MKIININKEEFLNLLLNRDSFSSGVYGKLVLNNDKLYKIYYKDFIEVYFKKNGEKLDEIVDNWLEIENELGYGLRDANKMLEKLKRLEDTKSSELISGVLSYRGLLVGIEMNYYKDYITLSEASLIVSKEELDDYIKKCCYLVQDLLLHNIIPEDIKEDNVLVNLKTGDVILIDLDDFETRYGHDDYINRFPHSIYNISDRLHSMINRLNNKNQYVLKKEID